MRGVSKTLRPRCAALSALCVTLLVPANAAQGSRAGGSPGSELSLDGLTLWNSGLAPSATLDAYGRWFGCLVREARQQADLNGDGDQNDDVLLFVNPDSRRIVSSRLATRFPQYPAYSFGNSFVIFASEELQGRDLNGDGDSRDVLLHIFDPESETLRQLDYPYGTTSFYGREDLVAVTHRGTRGTTSAIFDARGTRLTGLNGNAFALNDHQALLEAFESSFPDRLDLNGDGDTRDTVAEIYDARSNHTTNLRLALAPVAGPHLLWQDNALLMVVSEAGQEQDFTGDGLLDDAVLFHHDLLTGRTTCLGLAVQAVYAPFRPEGSPWVPVLAREDGYLDLNADGDRTDTVFHALDMRTGRVVNLGIHGFSWAHFYGDQAAGALSEQVLRRDLNGDGDQLDDVAHVFDLAGNRLINLKVAVDVGVVDNGPAGFAFGAPELDPFADDAPDPVLYLTDPATLLTRRLGRRVEVDYYVDYGPFAQFDFEERWLSFLSCEKNQDDLNGDGDREDSVVQLVYSASRGAKPDFIDTHEAGFPSFLGGDWAVWRTDESAQGLDLNHDGDRGDRVLRAYHGPRARRFDLADFTRADVRNGELMLWLPEAGRGDLNGDGDTNDEVLQWVVGP